MQTPSKMHVSFDLTWRYPITDVYDIHDDDATMAKCLHWTNITSHIQGMIIQIKTCFWRSNNNGIGVTAEDADPGPRLEPMMANEKGRIFIVPHLLWHGNTVSSLSFIATRKGWGTEDPPPGTIKTVLYGNYLNIYLEHRYSDLCLFRVELRSNTKDKNKYCEHVLKDSLQ